MIPRWCTVLLRPLILITPTRIRATTQAWGWHGARPDLPSVPGLAALGAIAIGITVGTSTSIIRTTSTRITLTTPTAARGVAAKPGVVSGNTIRNIAAMHLMGIAE